MGDDKQQRVIDASVELFSHYGFRRTTVGEIAKQAGISRPTLYAMFENKEAIFEATISAFADAMVAEIESDALRRGSLREQLEAAFEIALVRPVVKAYQSPHTREILSEPYDGAREVIDAAYTKLAIALEPCFADADLERVGLSASQLALLLTSAARGMKPSAKSPEELRDLLAGLTALVVAAVGG